MRKIHVRAFGPPGLFTPEAFFELLAGLDADLTVDVVEMGFDSAHRNAHGAGDVLIVLAFEEEARAAHDTRVRTFRVPGMHLTI